MPHPFADIHCHSTTKPFLTQRGPEEFRFTPFEFAENHINSWLLSRLKREIEKATEIRLATQSNFDNLYAGGHRVVIISLTPPEKGFFTMNQADDTFWDDAFKTLLAVQQVPYTGTIKASVINAFTGFCEEDIDYGKYITTSYFKDLLVPEYEFLKTFDGKKGKDGYTLHLTGSYTEIENILQNDPNSLCVVLSIEGMHSLYYVPGFGDLLNNQTTTHKNEPPNFTPLAKYLLNIDTVKSWEHPPFFITLYHHIWNGLGGHARSLNRLMTKLINQEEGINNGINDLGKEVIRRLLFAKNNAKRILLDVKHMSPRSRKDYYNMLLTEAELKDEAIPVICSHGSVVSKRKTLDEMVLLSDNDDWNELDDSTNFLHECSINLCEEDVQMIFKTKGIIGIQLDEKRIAGIEIIKIIQNKVPENEDEVNQQYAKVVLANMFRIVQIIQQKEAWDIIAIGSDFDGLINHLDCCPSAADVPTLEQLMLQFLNSDVAIEQAGFNYSIPKAEMQALMFGLSPQQIMEKVFYNNAVAFLKNNYK